MADDDDPLRSRSSDSAGTDETSSDQPEPKEATPDLPESYAPRAQLYKEPGGKPGPAYYQEQLEKSYDEAQRHAEEFKSVIIPYRDRVMAQLKAPAPQPPELIGPKSDPMRATQLLATTMPFLAIGSKHLRDYIGAAIAGTSPKFGFTWGDYRKRQYQEYNETLKAIKAYNTAQIQQYKAILSDRKLDVEDMLKSVKLIAETYQDVLKADAAKRKDLPAIIKHLENHETAETKRRRAADAWNLDQQKSWLKNPDNMKYATIVNNKFGIDLTVPDPEKFHQNLKAADKKYPYERFLQENKTKVDQGQPAAPGATPQAQYKPQGQAEEKTTDPLGLKSDKPATDQERARFEQEINSAMEPSD
ncbi:MAG: hypothetical protein DMG76_23770 [Acidobacteria bacterium]|nr:MAG: hypothetical protein DMG76_23770 [Acidobacteriota bacterium]